MCWVIISFCEKAKQKLCPCLGKKKGDENGSSSQYTQQGDYHDQRNYNNNNSNHRMKELNQSN